MALFDLSKAFDRVPHRPLVHKLRAVGVVGWLLSWFRSYLSCRTQLVAIRGVDSNPVPVFSGVFRALSWGPSSSLSMLMISVLPLFLLIALSTLCGMTQSSSNPSLLHLIWSTLSLISIPFMIGFVWIISLPMPLKSSSWSSLLREILSQMLLLIALNNQPTERVSSAKFLGIILSDKLSWDLYVDHICK